MTIVVARQLRVTLDSICNSCDVLVSCDISDMPGMGWTTLHIRFYHEIFWTCVPFCKFAWKGEQSEIDACSFRAQSILEPTQTWSWREMCQKSSSPLGLNAIKSERSTTHFSVKDLSKKRLIWKLWLLFKKCFQIDDITIWKIYSCDWWYPCFWDLYIFHFAPRCEI